jgi:hypothetical protein
MVMLEFIFAVLGLILSIVLLIVSIETIINSKKY